MRCASKPPALPSLEAEAAEAETAQAEAAEAALWKRLSAARNTFTKRRKAYFATLEAEREEVKARKENLVAERVAIQTYRDMVRYFGEKDPTTRVMLEGILAQEEEHANDMHDLLVSHEGRPMLDK